MLEVAAADVAAQAQDRGGAPGGDRPAVRLELRGIRVRRGERQVLEVERLTLGAGQVLAVLGPNGAGKTTLLHVCGFLLAPAAGEVVLDGAAVRGTPLTARRRATLLLQSPVLLAGSALQNVELGLRLRGLRRGVRRERALEWLARFGVAHLASRPARALSGGEAQRVALARALAFEPEIVLLDEPFTAMDQPTREELTGAAVAELRRMGAATVFVTHDRGEALQLADRAIVLAEGRVRQEGPPAELRERPVDALVAAFMSGVSAGRANR
ncbi:MAG TPA: ATP-binding cassette domain-containing protein [Dehalococcoidia bacterium]|nr:ATP-binding cassette domain-containing protein [Dehalococcoidia bacterium]